MIKELLSIVGCMLLWIAVFFFGFFVLFLIVMTWKIPLHNYQLRVLQRHFQNTAQPLHPAQSTLLTKMAEFGNFGQSNHCDYIVGEFRKSAFSREEVQKAYAGVGILSFDKTASIPIEVYLVDDIQDAAGYDYYLRSWLEAYVPTQEQNAQDLYFVFAMSAMHSPDGDFRCH